MIRHKNWFHIYSQKLVNKIEYRYVYRFLGTYSYQLLEQTVVSN